MVIRESVCKHFLFFTFTANTEPHNELQTVNGNDRLSTGSIQGQLCRQEHIQGMIKTLVLSLIKL